jgi:hypothetical protein
MSTVETTPGHSRDGLRRLWLTTFFPCCKRRARLQAIEGVPRESYVRICPRCKGKWEIERSDRENRPGVRVDVLTWTCVRAGREP